MDFANNFYRALFLSEPGVVKHCPQLVAVPAAVHACPPVHQVAAASSQHERLLRHRRRAQRRHRRLLQQLLQVHGERRGPAGRAGRRPRRDQHRHDREGDGTRNNVRRQWVKDGYVLIYFFYADQICYVVVRVALRIGVIYVVFNYYLTLEFEK